MSAAVAELDVERIDPVGGALRLGVLYDLLGRTIDRGRPHSSPSSVSSSATSSTARTRRASTRWQARLFRRAAPKAEPEQTQMLHWAALLHEIGMSVSHIGLSQARRLHPAARRHARVFGGRAGAARACWSTAVAAAWPRSGPSLTIRSCARRSLALRLAVLFYHARTERRSAAMWRLKTRRGVAIPASAGAGSRRIR